MGGRDPGTDKTIGILLTIVVLGTLLQVAVATGDDRPPAPLPAPSPRHDPQADGVASDKPSTLPPAIDQVPTTAVMIRPPTPVPIGGIQPSDTAITAPALGLAPARQFWEKDPSMKTLRDQTGEAPPMQILRHQTGGEAPQQGLILGSPPTDSVPHGAVQRPRDAAQRERRGEIKEPLIN